MATSMHFQTISATSQRVRHNFLSLISLVEEQKKKYGSFDLQSSVISDYLDRFSLWAGNMGAMHSPHSPSSLDQQLLEAADILEQMKRQLGDIIEAIGDLTKIILHGHPKSDTLLDLDICSDLASILGLDPIDESDEFSSDEITVALQIISESINSLFRLDMLVRKSASCKRFKKAIRISDPAFPDAIDIDYVKQKHVKLLNSRLLSRLGNAIAKRRQLLKYYGDRRSRSAVDEFDHSTTTIKQLSHEAITSAPSLNFPSGDILEDDYDISSSNASIMADSTSNPALPHLAAIARTQEAFECPICFTLQSFNGEKSWQIHAFGDLKAYVCTLSGEECDAELFEDRDMWFEHELRKHRCEYICTLCSHGPFSFERIAAHIQNIHGRFSDRQLQMLREGGRQNSIQFKSEDCPFCDEWTEALSSKTSPIGKEVDLTQDISVTQTQFKKHVAIHQEQHAILALQRATGNIEMSGSKVDNTSTSVAIPKSPLKTKEDPVDKIIDEVDGISLSHTNISTMDALNNAISAATNVDEIGIAEQLIPGLVSKYDEGPQKTAKNVEYRPLDRSQRTNSYRGGSKMKTWKCCKCGLGGLRKDTTPQCSEHDCQHPRCSNCSLYEDSMGPSRPFK
ncbi:hypothetical protein M431DRAFT_491969 [Trichoderma harzianum CBS 226.95]|uniref:Oxidoreductase acuF-like C2H2 type zinc-finger domain-containing protein n=1 Tax=Trichoderma harzianum CBS 226.95 TaxID=983964 RepID=A0A2T4AKW8_TRIHA|nr:hypothetical protein M431DRAFT_491969 [Trichoderma harzianum CBS 226.95]PTB57731.1 hypothetical protein M431DRAFT_491969 [Trichoderma harzianum CBS 226.95]